MDIISKAAISTSASSIQHSTVPGSVTSTLGGVARNVAEAAHRIRTSSSTVNKDDVKLVSPLGSDSFGSLVKEETAALGMRIDGFSFSAASTAPGASPLRTAVCNMILNSNGDLIGGVADMDIISSMQFNDVRDRAIHIFANTNKHKDSCPTFRESTSRDHNDGWKPCELYHDRHMSVGF